jgi:VWFA-related protein
MLNTPTEDQQVARNQLRNLATSLPDRQPIALFLLSSKLVMVQAFTTNTRELMAAVDKVTLQRSQVLTTEAERQHEVGTATYISQTLISPNTPAQAGVSGTAISDFQASTTNRALQSIRDMESLRLDQRVMFTLDAFAGLSRSMAGYPGRKNLIWLSGNFPLRVEPNSTLDDKWRNATNYRETLGRTMALLAQSRVAVYPVDIRGMQTRGVDISTSTTQSAAFVGGNSASNVGGSNDRTSSLLAEQTFTGANERETMGEVAEQTGGRAFINTNDFAGAIARAINDGASYYTLAYTPDNKDDKPAYHRIEVKLNHPEAKLSYRRGYYSQPEKANPQTGLAALQGALQPGMPPTTILFFSVSVKPSEANRKAVQISYLINGSNVTLTDVANGGKHIVVDCMAIAFDKEGKEVAHASDTLDGTLPASAVEAQLRRGLPASQELELKPGVYNVRVGVQDRASQSIGTVSIPVVVQ